jgi:AbrB family looped-hinge helix DNA binding protein
MRSTIDSAGRVVIPKPLRDRMGLAPGAELELREREGRIEIEPAPTPMRLSKGRHGLSALPAVALPPLTDEIVRATLERVRR